MAVAFRSQANANTGATAATSLVVSVPAGVVAGDMLVAGITSDGGTGVNFTSPAGWNLQQSTTQGTNTRMSTYWRLADGTEPASYTWNFDIAVQACGAILAYSGVHPFAPMARGSALNATPGTSLTPAGPQSSYIGMMVQVFGTRNTTAAATMTVGSGNTERLDISTSASPYINLQVQDAAKGWPVGGGSTAASTSSQSVTFAEHSFFLSETRPESIMVIDELTSGSSTTSVTSTAPASAFSTNYPNELIICLVTIGKSIQTVTSVTGASLTWELIGRANTKNGAVEAWRAFAPNPLNRQVITVNFSGAVVGCNSMIMGIRGVDATGANGSGAIGAVTASSSTAAAPSAVVTTTKSNSWVWAGFNDPDASRTVTVPAGQTNVRSFSDATNAVTTWMQMQNSITAAPGTAVTMNVSAPAADGCNVLAFEILPARKPRPPALFF